MILKLLKNAKTFQAIAKKNAKKMLEILAVAEERKKMNNFEKILKNYEKLLKILKIFDFAKK